MSEQMKMDYNEVFNTPQGKRVLEDLMTHCHVLEPATDLAPASLAFREGKRDAIFHILTRLGIGSKEFKDIAEGAAT